MLFVLLLMVVVLALFSRAQLNRLTSGASTSNVQSDILANSAIEMIVGDFRQEIASGSVEDSLASANPAIVRKVYEPITVDTGKAFIGANGYLSTAPSMVMQRVVATGAGSSPMNLAKQSLRDKPFFAVLSGYRDATAEWGAIPNRASAVSTTNQPLLGRAISTNRWRLPQLASTTETLLPPDWIYLTRNGRTPTVFSSSLVTRTAGNEDCAVGRFAYNIYDTGGLIDINVVGNALIPSENARRGYLHQVSLKNAPSPLTIPNFDDFIKWRSAGESANTTGAGGLFDPKRTFTTVPAGSQAFVTRQDLLRYVAQTNTISTNALPYLTTYSRDLNAPSYAPDPNRPLLPADPSPQKLNPPLTEARYASETVINRGEGSAKITMPAGSPVLARRFPLSKLSLLSVADPDPSTINAIKYYFGLTKNANGAYDYTETINGRIALLSEVAGLKREPNFFEVLQATITTGSLGRDAANSYTIDYLRDRLRNLQVIQIGANIIDQWDGDDLPTEIRFPDAAGGTLSSYGVENLPYLNNFVIVPHRPVWDRKRVQAWGLFDVWNPHRNAPTSPKGINGFRIKAISGKGSVTLRYELLAKKVTPPTQSYNPYQPFFSGPAPFKADPPNPNVQSILALNPAFDLTFPVSGDYSEPTVVGGGVAPTSANDHPGFLMWEHPDVPPAVPAKASRTYDVQYRLNELMDTQYPYTTNPANASFTTDPQTGDRAYPKDTQFVTPPDSTHWNKSGTDPIIIYAKYPVKAHNYFRYTPSPLPDKTVFHLQYQDAVGAWHTYQVMNQFMPRSVETDATILGHNSGTPTLPSQEFADSWRSDPPSWWKDTYHTEPGFDDKACFYGWRQPKWSISFFKFDPRTIRFGYSANEFLDTLGTTIRTSPLAFPKPQNATELGSLYGDSRWRILTDGSPGTFPDTVVPAFSWVNLLPASSVVRSPAMAMMNNAPDGALALESQNFGRYADLDGITRPADGYLGALPTVPGRMTERPVMLNRPFRSVGELGYVFRDMPWKTLDFFSRNSGDLGLLDAFSVEETEGDTAVVAGRVNLNSASPQVLRTLLIDSGNHVDLPAEVISDSVAIPLSASIRAEATNAPFRDRGDLVRRLLGVTNMNISSLAASGLGDLTRTKIQSEAAIRTLSEIGSTRTWNVLVDLIVQTGQFTPTSKDLANFAVQSERRYWVHLAIDRLTGRVVGQQWEIVDE